MATGLVVHLEIKPGDFDEFVDIARAHGKRCVAEEPGCLGFQVMVLQDQPNRVILVEVCRDNEALESHWRSEHMAAYRHRVTDMIVERKRFRCTV